MAPLMMIPGFPSSFYSGLDALLHVFKVSAKDKSGGGKTRLRYITGLNALTSDLTTYDKCKLETTRRKRILTFLDRDDCGGDRGSVRLHLWGIKSYPLSQRYSRPCRCFYGAWKKRDGAKFCSAGYCTFTALMWTDGSIPRTYSRRSPKKKSHVTQQRRERRSERAGGRIFFTTCSSAASNARKSRK